MCQEKSDHLIVYSKGKSSVKKRREKKKEKTELGNRNSRRGERRKEGWARGEGKAMYSSWVTCSWRL